MSKKNSTFRIIGRLAIVVGIVAIIEGAARLAYLEGNWYHGPTFLALGQRGYSSEKTFWNYPWDDVPQVFTTHLIAAGAIIIAAVIAMILIAVIAWIFDSSDDTEIDTLCTNASCTCPYHREVYRDGQWQEADCANQACTCGYHQHEVFIDGKWVTA